MGLLYACAVGQDPEGGHGQQVPGHAHLIGVGKAPIRIFVRKSGYPVGPVMEPLAQVLAGRVPAQAQGRQSAQDGVLATAAGQNGPAHLQGQALELAGPQVRQVLGEALRMGMECGRKKHGWPQVLVSSSIQGTAMLFLLPEPFFFPGLTLPTPIRPCARGRAGACGATASRPA